MWPSVASCFICPAWLSWAEGSAATTAREAAACGGNVLLLAPVCTPDAERAVAEAAETAEYGGAEAAEKAECGGDDAAEEEPV